MKINLKDIREDQLKQLRRVEIMKELYSFLTESMKLTHRERGKPPTLEETSTLIESSVEAIEEIFSGVKNTETEVQTHSENVPLLLVKAEIATIISRIALMAGTGDSSDKNIKEVDKLIEEIIEVARR